MKVKVSADSQEEFNKKRKDLLKAFCSDTHEVIEKAGKIPTAPKKNFYLAHTHMQDHWDERFRQTLTDIKKEISEVIGG